jgi:peptidoglycan hydrolase-like protein with peptidoglycan-binding domain
VNSGPQLAFGARGDDVRRAQTIFVMIKILGFDGIDGIFGTLTKNAVIAFQESEGLTADGVIGDDTWSRMPADPNTPVLRRGSTGSAVSGLQKGLLKFGGAASPTDPGPADGDFGRRTEAAVKSYQTQHSLDDDGVVGPRSWWVPAGAAGATLASLSELTTAAA